MKKKRYKFLDYFLVLVAFLCYPIESSAQKIMTITLKNDSVIQGCVETSTTEMLRLRTDKGVITIRRGQIESAVYSQAESITGSPQGVRDNAAWIDSMPYITPDKRNAFDKELIDNSTQVLSECRTATTRTIAKFDTYLSEHPTTAPPELYLICAECWYLAGESEGMIEKLEDLMKYSPDSISNTSETTKWAIDNTMICLKQALKNGNADIGVRCLSLLSKFSKDTVPVDAKLLRCAEVSAKKQRGDFVDAMQVLINYVAPVDTKLAFMEGCRLLNEMKDHKADDRDRFRALSLFCPVFIESEFSQRGIPYFCDYGDLLTKETKFDEAMKLSNALETLNSGYALNLRKRIQLGEKLDTIPMSDVQNRYLLAGRAKDEGLIDEAIEIYQSLIDDSDAGENAKLQLALIKQEKEKKIFDSIKSDMEKGNYQSVIKLCREFIVSHPDSKFYGQAIAQIELARFRMKQQDATKPAQAEVLMQNAERAYFEKNYDLAGSLLVQIEADYANTQSAERARELRKKLSGGYVGGTSAEMMGETHQLGEAMELQAAYLGAIRAAYDNLELSLGK